jgi:hypothetical protein
VERSVKTHELKTWPEAFEAMVQGFKVHEIRQDDRDFQVGDTLLLREWDPSTEEYSDRWMEVEITYLSRGPEWGIPDGVVVMSIGRAAVQVGEKVKAAV